MSHSQRSFTRDTNSQIPAKKNVTIALFHFLKLSSRDATRKMGKYTAVESKMGLDPIVGFCPSFELKHLVLFRNNEEG